MLGYLREKRLDTFLGAYARHRLERLARGGGARPGEPRHLLFALCDHWEPEWNGVSGAQANARVCFWTEHYPRLAEEFRDADGRRPRHTFFFPGEQYRPAWLDALARLARQGIAEVEVHLHHENDTEATLRRDLLETVRRFALHGHLAEGADGRKRYAFIHGNWCLANARADGGKCGVDAELPLLFDTGCYADFTFPAAPDESQPNVVNRIYWPSGDLARRRAYEGGERARVGEVKRDRILLIQGPLALAVRRGKVPIALENGSLTAASPGTAHRVRRWIREDVHVAGRPEWLFVKVHTHGAPELQAASLLGAGGRTLHRALAAAAAPGSGLVLHYVTAREMFNIAVAAMDGHAGDPMEYKDHVLPPPPASLP